MRRPNRSIEVFDISLVAVVSKAMGAFLVLMIVFMQYYSSGPLGQNTAQQLSEQIEQTQKNTVEALRRLIEKANPEDIAKLLEEARRRLEESKQLIDQLRRENDALNAQAQRLDQQNAQLEKEIQDLQRKLSSEKYMIAGHLTNWDCMDVRFRLGLILPNMYLIRGKEQDRYVLNDGATLGQGESNSDREFLRANPKSTSVPGTGARFNNASFQYVTDPGTFHLVIVKQDMEFQQLKKHRGYPLRRSQRDCTILVALQAGHSGKSQLHSTFTLQIGVAKDSFAIIPYEVRLRANDGALELRQPSQEILAWLSDQIANAAKVSP